MIRWDRLAALAPWGAAVGSATFGKYLVENWRGIADALASVLP